MTTTALIIALLFLIAAAFIQSLRIDRTELRIDKLRQLLRHHGIEGD